MARSKLVPIGIRVPYGVAEWLRKEAEENRRSVASQLTWCAEQVKKQQERRPQEAVQ